MPSLQLGSSAPDFSIVDDDGAARSLVHFRGAPVIVAFTPPAQTIQPPIQYLTFEGERLPLLSPADATLAEQYGVTDQFADALDPVTRGVGSG